MNFIESLVSKKELYPCNGLVFNLYTKLLKLLSLFFHRRASTENYEVKFSRLYKDATLPISMTIYYNPFDITSNASIKFLQNLTHR